MEAGWFKDFATFLELLTLWRSAINHLVHFINHLVLNSLKWLRLKNVFMRFHLHSLRSENRRLGNQSSLLLLIKLLNLCCISTFEFWGDKLFGRSRYECHLSMCWLVKLNCWNDMFSNHFLIISILSVHSDLMVNSHASKSLSLNF